jgi:hypothetical protein
MKILASFLRFYFATAAFYGIFSFLTDVLCYQLDYGSLFRYRHWGSAPPYALAFLMLYFPVSLIGTACLFCMVVSFPNKEPLRWVRYAMVLIFGLWAGYAVQRSGIHFYIGKYLEVKNMITFALTAISVEMLRTYRKKKRELKEAEERAYYSMYQDQES